MSDTPFTSAWYRRRAEECRFSSERITKSDHFATVADALKIAEMAKRDLAAAIRERDDARKQAEDYRGMYVASSPILRHETCGLPWEKRHE